MKKRYRLTPRAQIDLTEIIEHIAEHSPQNAIKVFDELHEAMRKLARMPGMGHRREDVTDLPVLFWAVHSYLIVYRRDRDPIEIIHIVHGARDLKALFKQN
jgi:plasmid stabilization system protein ParE